jgi:hypothetical protein
VGLARLVQWCVEIAPSAADGSIAIARRAFNRYLPSHAQLCRGRGGVEGAGAVEASPAVEQELTAMPKIEEQKSKPAAKGGARSEAKATKPAAKTVRKRADTDTATMSPDLQEKIRTRAYELWESEGRPESRDLAHWHQAEREVGKARDRRADAKA